MEFQTVTGVNNTSNMSRPPKGSNIGGSGSHLKASEQGSHMNNSKLSSKIKAGDLRKSSMAGISNEDAASMMKASHMSGTKIKKLDDDGGKELDQNGIKIRIKEISLV